MLMVTEAILLYELEGLGHSQIDITESVLS